MYPALVFGQISLMSIFVVMYIRRKETNQPIGKHFNLPGHSQDNVGITILERVKVNNILYRQEREKYLIRKFNTFYSGMNKSPGIL